MFNDVLTVYGDSMEKYGQKLSSKDTKLSWEKFGNDSSDDSIVRTYKKPFSETGGLKLLKGNVGRSVMKISAIPEEKHIIEGPAIIFDSQEELLTAFDSGSLEKDFIAVVRFQGPKANGMPELHKLTPPMSILQNKGFKVAIVTDGRMSGASGKVPAAIHMSPEAALGGSIAKIKEGDMLRINATVGSLNVLVDEDTWFERKVEVLSENKKYTNAHGMGRELFGAMRKNVLTAEEGAVTWT